jgi:hypothetical protein
LPASGKTIMIWFGAFEIIPHKGSPAEEYAAMDKPL